MYFSISMSTESKFTIEPYLSTYAGEAKVSVYAAGFSALLGTAEARALATALTIAADQSDKDKAAADADKAKAAGEGTEDFPDVTSPNEHDTPAMDTPLSEGDREELLRDNPLA